MQSAPVVAPGKFSDTGAAGAEALFLRRVTARLKSALPKSKTKSKSKSNTKSTINSKIESKQAGLKSGTYIEARTLLAGPTLEN
jgi:hypothetical protein